MKTARKTAGIAAAVILIATMVNWNYIVKLMGLTFNAAVSVVSEEGVSGEFQAEMDSLGIEKFINVGLFDRFMKDNNIKDENGQDIDLNSLVNQIIEGNVPGLSTYEKEDWKIISSESAEIVNAGFEEAGYEPPYKPGTQTSVIELIKDTEAGKFIRVYDNAISSQAGGWVMLAEDIAGLTPQQIQNKFALPAVPIYVTDVMFESGTILRTGIANGLFGFEGGGIQFDLMGQRIGEFINERLLP